MSASSIPAQVSDPAIVDLPLKGKYDRRGGKRINSGRKPLHEKHLSRNTAAKLFRQFSIKEECERLLASKDERLRFEVIRYLWDRLEGKPFTAVNPAEQKAAPTVNNDNRLQIAIQALIPDSKPAKGKKAKLTKVSDVTNVTNGHNVTLPAKQLPVAEVTNVSTDAPKS